MNRRSFLKAAACLPAVAAVPALAANPESYLVDAADWLLPGLGIATPRFLWVTPNDAELARRILGGFSPAYATVSEALDTAQPGDAIVLLPGEHRA